MTENKISDIAASVRQRLLGIIRKTGDDANLVWTRYATEPFPQYWRAGGSWVFDNPKKEEI